LLLLELYRSDGRQFANVLSPTLNLRACSWQRSFHFKSDERFVDVSAGPDPFNNFLADITALRVIQRAFLSRLVRKSALTNVLANFRNTSQDPKHLQSLVMHFLNSGAHKRIPDCLDFLCRRPDFITPKTGIVITHNRHHGAVRNGAVRRQLCKLKLLKTLTQPR